MASGNLDVLTLAGWSRFKSLRKLVLRRVESTATAFEPGESSVRIVFGGDVMFDPILRTMWHLGLHRLNIGSSQQEGRRIRDRITRRLVSLLASSDCYWPESSGPFDEFSVQAPEDPDTVRMNAMERRMRRIEVDWKVVGTDYDYPFRELRSFFTSKDLVVVNLETPLTTDPRACGLFKSHPGYAAAMRSAGISLVNLANNHVFDAGERGFLDTLRYVTDAGMGYFGGGLNRAAARAGTRVEVRGTRIAFLGYTQGCNAHFASLADEYAGVLPLDRRMMIEDVRALRPNADLVIVSVHWGVEHAPNVHPTQVDIAHRLIDEGADAVIGHHPHVPQGIEIYRRKPIVYSLGNLVFAQRHHPTWGDNFLAELVIDGQQLRGVIVHPVAGREESLFQPALLAGSEARALLQQIQLRSLPFSTKVAFQGDKGYVSAN